MLTRPEAMNRRKRITLGSKLTWEVSILRPLTLSGVPLESRAHRRSSRALVIKLILAEEISKNPCCSGNRECLGGLAPIRMIVGIRKKQWHPNEQTKDHEHQCE